MKKKLNTLLEKGQVAKNARFNALYHEYQAACDALQKARTERESARKAYRKALKERGSGTDNLFEVLIELRKTKYLRQYQRAVYQLAKFHLRQWIDRLGERKNRKTGKKQKSEGRRDKTGQAQNTAKKIGAYGGVS